MGPTNRTLSISPSVEKPEFRNISEFAMKTSTNAKKRKHNTLREDCAWFSIKNVFGRFGRFGRFARLKVLKGLEGTEVLKGLDSFETLDVLKILLYLKFCMF